MRRVVLLMGIVAALPLWEGSAQAGDDLLHRVHVYNGSHRKVSVWVQVEDIWGRLHDAPGEVLGPDRRQAVACPTCSPAGIWVRRVHVGVWDGVSPSKTIPVPFSGGPTLRRFLIGEQGPGGPLTLEELR